MEVDSARKLVRRFARDRDDCRDLLDALGLLRSALEASDLDADGLISEVQEKGLGEVDGEGGGRV